MNYAKDQPVDKRNNAYAYTPAYTSQQSQNGVPTASSVITLSVNTTVLDVMVIGGAAGNSGIIGKWGSASVTGTNFDWQVNSGQNRTFVVPINPSGTVNPSSVQGMNTLNTLYSTVAVKVATAQSASVFTAEY